MDRHELAAEYSATHKGISCLVMLDGKIVFEDYPNGGKSDRAHDLASGTKSFWGIVAVAAAQDGLLTLDEPASETITEWKEDPRRSKATLRHILSLTAGQPHGAIGKVPTYAEAIRVAFQADPGAKFVYGSNPYQTFGEVLRRKLVAKNEGPLDYLERRIFKPIGLKHGDWRKGLDGQPHLPSGAWLTAGEWAKFGELVRLGGEWNGKHIVPKDLLDECFKGTDANPAYGLTWWLNREVPPEILAAIPPLRFSTDVVTAGRDIVPDLVFAAGAGKQRLYVSRALKLVVVRQAEGIAEALEKGERGGFSDAEFLSRLVHGTDAASKPIG